MTMPAALPRHCPACGQPLDAGWPPFCPRCWRMLPAALADAVRGHTSEILRGERPDAFEVACGWLELRQQEAASMTRRMTGESDL